VGQSEEMSGEGYGAEEGEEVAQADAVEEIFPGGSGWGGEEEKAGEGEDGSEGRGPAGGVGVGRTESGDDGQEWDEDDDEAGDKGGFCRGGTGEAGGLELVACGEEEADDGSGG